MTREDAKKAAEVMLAYADGKELDWKGAYVNNEPSFNWHNDVDTYRIKPTPTYRPFANAEECWEEMKKHEPFGWITHRGEKEAIMLVKETAVKLHNTFYYDYKEAKEKFTFADGSVFGKLTEEENEQL